MVPSMVTVVAGGDKIGVGDIRVVEAGDFTAGAIAPVHCEVVVKPTAQRQRDASLPQWWYARPR